MKTKVAIIDSGVKLYPEFPIELISGCGIVRDDEGGFVISDDFEDKIGHGTAVTDLILKKVALIDSIYCVKIYDNVNEVDVDTLIYALNYINDSVECNIVVISSGVTFCDKYDELEEVINMIYEKGICIIAAFDNEGSISFPAAFNSVIGVAIMQKGVEYARVSQNSDVDIVISICNYRVRWVSPPKLIIAGSSFAVPYVAGLILEVIYESADNECVNKKDYILRKIAEKLEVPFEENDSNPSTWERGNTFVKEIKKAVVFPWNKEVHSIGRYHNLLSFHVEGYYDVKYNLNIGRSIGEFTDESDYSIKIANIDNLDWESDFDTIICGHCQELSAYCKRDFLREIIDKCEKYQKRLYTFDLEAQKYIDEEKRDVNYFVPGIYQEDLPKMLGGRLYNRLTPVVGVMGTSSRQGKFTVQMGLRDKFQKEGYNVGQIATEPSGYLFGCKAVFPFGYNANVNVEASDSVAVINQMVWEASDHNSNDIVIVGGQSGSVPYSYGNLSQFNFAGYNFLCGTNPDVFVLCVNPHDPVDYIVRTIKYLESFSGMPVVSIVVFPIKYEASTQIGYGYRQRKISRSEFSNIKNEIFSNTKIPVYLLGEQNSITCIYSHIIDALR